MKRKQRSGAKPARASQKRRGKRGAPIKWDEVKNVIKDCTTSKTDTDGKVHLIEVRDVDEQTGETSNAKRLKMNGHDFGLGAWYFMMQLQVLMPKIAGTSWWRTCKEKDCCAHSVLRTNKCKGVDDFKCEGDWELAQIYLMANSRPATEEEIKNNEGRNLVKPCRVWTASDSGGTPMAHFSDCSRAAHCLAWEVHHRQLLPSPFGLHWCNTKLCIEPTHIYPGTMEQNHGEDRIRDGTDVFGEGNPAAKITAEIANAIFEAGLSGESLQSRAVKFDISESEVSCIDRGESWWDNIRPELRARWTEHIKRNGRLSREQVEKIRERLRKNDPMPIIAAEYKIELNVVRGIQEGTLYSNPQLYVRPAPAWKLGAEELGRQKSRIEERCQKGEDANACWMWKTEGKSATDKYPQISFQNRPTQVRRLVYMLWNQKEIPKGQEVYSSCGERLCNAPHHLAVGTRADIIKARRARGTIHTGEAHHASKLSDAARAAIVQELQNGAAIPDIVRKFGTTEATVKGIKAKPTRTHA